MMFSLIIPVYNRPDEVDELLESLSQTTYDEIFEIVLIEDGSTIRCQEIAQKYGHKLDISYYYKENSGPGDSRNYGMKKARGDYFIIFDSDCIIPSMYLSEVDKALKQNYVDCFGGPDKALDSFSDIQKAINFAMTSFLTTGGIRGGSEKIGKFQPRSFNMGLSKKAFEASNGFGNIHPGEDPDLSIRLWNLGFETRLFENAFVYHKRRIDWDKFSVQVNKFGKARPILNSWYPQYNKLTFFFPTFFIIGFFVSLLLLVFNQDFLLKFYFVYFLALFLLSSIQNKSIKIGYLSIIAVWKQFYGYGIGFLESFVKVIILKQKPQEAFPELFFKIKND
jgi:glycosyltransferase involved in cell wall biosynthesis